MTSLTFCEFVNNELLPSQNLSPNFPQNVSLDTNSVASPTCFKPVSHKKGVCIDGHSVASPTCFKPVSHKKGVCIDRHERHDVVKLHDMFLTKLSTCKTLICHPTMW